MIFSNLANAGRYSKLHPLFFRAFEFIRHTDLRALAPGHHDIEGDNLFAIVEHEEGRTRAEAKLECHRRYIDIQYVLEGVDEMGWKSLPDCRYPADDYDAGKDIRFFDDKPAAWIATPPGHFCIFFPEDAHAPLVSNGFIRKAVFKIAVGAG
ncbi:MAG: YhcH/YjgK/YiaL family protein [Gallionella sp.]|nr:YhcH/YjgK/YiaL family protein [Gallionella sp.]